MQLDRHVSRRYVNKLTVFARKPKAREQFNIPSSRKDSFMIKSALLRSLSCLAAAVALVSCSSAPNCEEPSDAPYLKAEDRGALKVPGGLAQPDRTAGLAIPPPPKQPAAQSGCLDRVPSYFGNAGRLAASPEEMVADWAQAWADRNSEAVVAMYAEKFEAESTDRATWLAQRRTEVAAGSLPNARLENVKISAAGTDRQRAVFTQRFDTQSVQRELTLVRESGTWKILSERII